MTKDQIERHIGRGPGQYQDGARLRTRSGAVVGLVRHSGGVERDSKKPVPLAKDNDGEYWHVHETNGAKHCTRRLHTHNIVGPA